MMVVVNACCWDEVGRQEWIAGCGYEPVRAHAADRDRLPQQPRTRSGWPMG